MRLSTALREAFASFPSEGGEPATYEDLLEQFGSNAAIADAAGLTETGSTERRSFMRNLQRYATGERHAPPERMRELAEEVGAETGGDTMSRAEAVAAVREAGLDFYRLWAWVRISKDRRLRDIPGANNVYTADPELLGELLEAVEAGDWAAAAELFVQAVVIDAYGMPAGTEVEDVHGLVLGVAE